MKENKGITLIALVITIIILLILAGISIATLLGENGILTQVKKAKTETEYKGAEEKVKIAVIGARADDGQLTVEELEAEVGYQGGSLAGDAFPVDVQMDGHTFIVDSNGGISDKVDYSKAINVNVNGVKTKITPKNVNQYIGKKVKYTPKSPETNYGTSNIYRILYIDFDNKFNDGSGTIFIKADVDNKKVDISDYNISGIDDDYVIPLEGKKNFEKLNPILGLISEEDNTTNKKYCTWLANSQNWIGYQDEKIKENINYIVGAPSLEMIVDSYNLIYPEDKQNYSLGRDFGYAYNYTKFKYNNNCISPDIQDYSYFLLSPSDMNGGSMEYANMSSYCFLVKNNEIISTGIGGTCSWGSEKASICPVVSISPNEILNLI